MVLLSLMTREYELMVVLRPDFGVEEKPARDLVQKLVGDREIKEFAILGKKRLAYIIKKQTDGVYVLATVTGTPLQVVDVEKQIRSGVDVLRYLLTVKN